jgi:hypothetical protein
MLMAYEAHPCRAARRVGREEPERWVGPCCSQCKIWRVQDGMWVCGPARVRLVAGIHLLHRFEDDGDLPTAAEWDGPQAGSHPSRPRSACPLVDRGKRKGKARALHMQDSIHFYYPFISFIVLRRDHRTR